MQHSRGQVRTRYEKTGAQAMIEVERIVTILMHECDDLDNPMPVLHTLAHREFRFGDLPASPMVLAGWAKQLRANARKAGSDQS